jgi:hypothetical protein
VVEQRLPDRPLDGPRHGRFVVEPNFGLARVDVDVHRVGGEVEKEDGEGVAVAGQLAAVGVDDRRPERGGGHVPAVDERREVLPAAAGRLGMGNQPLDGAHRAVVARPRDVDHGLGHLAAVHREDGRAPVAPAVGRERLPAVVVERHRHVRVGQRVLGDDGVHPVELGGGGLQELPARRRVVKEVVDLDDRAGGTADGRDLPDFAARDGEFVAPVGAGRTAPDRRPRDRRDGVQRLPPEAERADPVEVGGVSNFGGGVLCHREFEFVGGHARPVVADPDAVGAVAVDAHRDPRGARVEAVFHQFLHDRRRPLDDLAGGDALDGPVVQPADRRRVGVSGHRPPLPTRPASVLRGRAPGVATRPGSAGPRPPGTAARSP